MRAPSHRPAAWLTILAAAAALGVALGSQAWAGLVPCALCLLERWPYRIAIALGVLALLLPRQAGRVVLGLALIAVLAGAGLAFVHVGVEWGWWPSPLPECAAPHFIPGTIAERLASMPARPSKPCDAPTYLIPFVPVSMAAMNLIYALGFAAVLGDWLRHSARRRR
ncbi:MAG: disulfide bond formation protein B [Rhodospirillales bacterium]|nr:disulfide bond formation protein B [Rhodospirillales bacterium]